MIFLLVVWTISSHDAMFFMFRFVVYLLKSRLFVFPPIPILVLCGRWTLKMRFAVCFVISKNIFIRSCLISLLRLSSCSCSIPSKFSFLAILKILSNVVFLLLNVMCFVKA